MVTSVAMQQKPKKTVSIVIGLALMFWVQNVIAAGILSGMRIGQTDEKTRVVFDLKKSDKYRVQQLNNPSRLVVDFFDTANYLSFKRKHITDNRVFKIRVAADKQKTRVVLDLHKTPDYQTFFLSNAQKGRDRLVIDLTEPKAKQNIVQKAIKPAPVKVAEKAEKVKPTVKVEKKQALDVAKLSNKQPAESVKAIHSKQAVKPQTKQTAPTTVAKAEVKSLSEKGLGNGAILKKQDSEKAKPIVDIAKKDNAKPIIDKAPKALLDKDSAVLIKPAELVVAIDAGHGGKDTGAIGHNNVYEKHATLMMAKELKKKIDRQPGMRAILTRDKDVFIPLSKRVKIAKQKNADIFISIHADAFHDNSVRGGSVYVLSERGASSTMARLLARSENAALDEIRLKGMDDDVAFALSDLSREANIKASRKLAKTVLKQMGKTVKMHKHSVQSAGFAVLKSIDMPSLLIETAFISNPHEARNLMSRNFQRKMASAIVDGLNQYAADMTPKQRWGDTLYVHYQVQKGDTLSEIAQTYQVSTLTLKKVNKIKNANSLYVGKKLKIPVSDKLMAGI